MTTPLTAPYVLEYSYKRSLGDVLSRFVTALRDKRILGVRAEDGRVLVPPQEYDPVTAAPLDALVEVANEGVITTWTWVDTPYPEHPGDGPFAFALIQLDGADTAMMHAVCASLDAMKTGARVRAVWRDESERGQGVRDISHFEVVDE